MKDASITEDIFERIAEQIRNIEGSYLFYRSEAKQHKLNVLKAAQKYLTGEITQKQFTTIIDSNKKYGDSLGKSNTEKLIQEALRTQPDSSRTREGYYKGEKYKSSV